MRQRFTWNKEEKLKSRKRIECVFKEGKSFSVFPFRVFYLLGPCGQAGQPRTVTGQARIAAVQPGGAVQAAAVQPGEAVQAPTVTGQAQPPVVEPGVAGQPEETVQAQAAVLAQGDAVQPKATIRAKAVVQAGFGAGSRHFKKAVDRNRIKRLSREAYRLQKQPLIDQMREKGLCMAVFFIYTGKELPDYQTVSGKIGVVLQKLIRETA